MSEPKDPNGLGKYMYCIIRCPEPRQFTTLGISEGGDVVDTVHLRDLAAVVSDSPVVEYERAGRDMKAHTAALEEVMQEFTILPVCFGTVASGVEAIQEQVLRRRYDELNGLVNEMEGRDELGLKAFWVEEVIFRETVEENPPIRRLRDRLKGRSAEATHFDRIRLGEMVEEAMKKKRGEDAEKILARLRPLACKTRAVHTFTDRMVLNGAFLVDQGREDEFDEAVQQLEAEMSDRLTFKYVGPVPPYNFVSIVISWDEE